MEDKTIRVLLVDDEEELLEYLAKRLGREGFTVHTVTSGQAALELIETEDFEVAVVDLKMPGMDGLETQGRLKERRPLLQTVVLTGHGSIQAALESGKHDAFRFLGKPADFAELVKTLREAATVRARLARERFQEELAEVSASGGSPREILAAVEALRKKYGMHKA
jgi:two-component system NtrC family response regulator